METHVSHDVLRYPHPTHTHHAQYNFDGSNKMQQLSMSPKASLF
jgi:hypothetical protein